MLRRKCAVEGNINLKDLRSLVWRRAASAAMRLKYALDRTSTSLADVLLGNFFAIEYLIAA